MSPRRPRLEWELIARAHVNPLRLRILEALAEVAPEPVSPSDLRRDLDASLGVVAYHVRQLADAGLLELVGTRPRRGALEHFYRLTPEATR